MNKTVAYVAALLAALPALGSAASAETRPSYPQVRVELLPSYTPDAAFEKFRKQFVEAVANKDAHALSALVAPGFVWTVHNALANYYDPGRDSQHNFRVVFGFRAAGKDVDGNVENGP